MPASAIVSRSSSFGRRCRCGELVCSSSFFASTFAPRSAASSGDGTGRFERTSSAERASSMHPVKASAADDARRLAGDEVGRARSPGAVWMRCSAFSLNCRGLTITSSPSQSTRDGGGAARPRAGLARVRRLALGLGRRACRRRSWRAIAQRRRPRRLGLRPSGAAAAGSSTVLAAPASSARSELGAHREKFCGAGWVSPRQIEARQNAGARAIRRLCRCVGRRDGLLSEPSMERLTTSALSRPSVEGLTA